MQGAGHNPNGINWLQKNETPATGVAGALAEAGRASPDPGDHSPEAAFGGAAGGVW